MGPGQSLPLILLPSIIVLVLLIAPVSASLVWVKTWGGSETDRAFGIAVDASGNVYTTGSTDSFGPGNSTGHSAITLLKYDSSGILTWQETWSENSSYSAVGNGVAVDGSGNVYVAGSNGPHAILLKFDSSGALLWQREWQGIFTNVAADPLGGIYVTGTTSSFGAGKGDIILLKFNSTGNMIWERAWGSTANDDGRGVAADSSGNVYVTGSIHDDPCFLDCGTAVGSDVLLLKYNSTTGSLLWQKSWSSPGNGYDFGNGVALDAVGNIYVAGETDGAALLLKFDPFGSLWWQKTWTAYTSDFALGVAVGPSSSAYVVGGTSHGFNQPVDVFLLRFYSSGTLLWQKTWGGSNNEYDLGHAVAVDSSGNALVAGEVDEASPYNFATPTGILSTPTNSLQTSTNLDNRIPIIPPSNATGTVNTPAGAQSYAGTQDQFLMKFSPTLIAEVAPITALASAMVPLIILMTRRKRLDRTCHASP